MKQDDYLEYLEERETDLEKQVEELYQQVDQLEEDVELKEKELEEKEYMIEDIEGKLDMLDDHMLETLKEAAYNLGFCRYMGTNLVLVEDGPIGYYEKSYRDIKSHQNESDTQRSVVNVLDDIYCNIFPANLRTFIEENQKKGEKAAKERIQNMKNSPDPFERKVAGGK